LQAIIYTPDTVKEKVAEVYITQKIDLKTVEEWGLE